MNRVLFSSKSILTTSTLKRFYSHNISKLLEPYTKNKKIINWIQETSDLCGPKDVKICDGSIEEYNTLIEEMLQKKTITKVKKRENCYLARSDPKDVARVEKQTYICSEKQQDAGPTNNWVDPTEMKTKLKSIFKNSMKGRTLYVVPFSMGPLNGNISKIGIEITDSPYVVASMRVMTRMGKPIFDVLNSGSGEFVPCLHSSGKPIHSPSDDVAWPCNSEKYIVHFPEERSIWSYGSSYGGNALLGKKCLALRIASIMGHEEGWLAEHMLILGITNPKGEKKYIAAAFPSACGKTNLALLKPSIPGWKVETMGDDIAWMKFGSDGRLYAINPENGFFGVAPGTSEESNENAMKMLSKNTIFTNVAETPEGDIWWEGMTKTKPQKLTDWKGNDWNPSMKEKAAHGNSRFCVPIQQCPVLDANFEKSNGVPIDAILFGGRRDTTIPLVFQSYNWNHGVLVGASISSEQTEAAEGRGVRHDPFAMLPFCGYNMADYFNHWVQMKSKTQEEKLPKIFQVNWFKKDSKGDFLWPGFAENSRVLKWVFERTNGEGKAIETPIGWIPEKIDTEGIQIEKENMEKLFEIDSKEWTNEINEVSNYLNKTFGDKLPKELNEELKKIQKRISN